jgi:hypothetical protein
MALENLESLKAAGRAFGRELNGKEDWSCAGKNNYESHYRRRIGINENNHLMLDEIQ